MTRFRWGLGAVLAAVGVFAAARSLVTYVEHALWLGAAAVIVLAAIAIGGFASLARARLRLAREAAGLAATPPRGSLWEARRAALVAVKERGAVPDADALASATAAEETGRAYLGRYLVAVTVLVGLVGTFAGLMETLQAMAPLLRDESRSAVQAIAASLAGLDVTFGASIVGILVTLALSLVQGDLTLAEEQVLARLEERSRHVLVPELWPPREAPAERQTRELVSLREEMRRFVSAAVEATTARVSAVAEEAVERLDSRVRIALADTVAEAHRATSEALEQMASTVGASLAASAREASAAVVLVGESAATAARDHQASVRALEQAAAGLTAATERVGERVASATERVGERVEAATERVAERVEAVTERVGERIAAASEGAAKALVSSSDAAAKALVASNDAAARSIATASEGAVKALSSAVTGVTDGLDATVARSADRVVEATVLLSGELERLARGQHAAMDAVAASVAAELVKSQAALAGVTAAVCADLSRAHDAFTDGLGAQAAAIATACDAAVAGVEARLASVAEALVERLEAASRAATEQALAELGERRAALAEATAALAKAAAELREGAATLAPALGALAPELGALGREVALLGGRLDGDGAGTETVLLEELARVGEDVRELHGLVGLARAAVATPEHVRPREEAT